MRWLLATCLMVLSSVVAAETIVLATMDIRRSPTSAPLVHRTNPVTEAAKTITFTLYTGDLWENNPGSHLYMVTDGYITPGAGYGSLQGRGIIMGHTPFCKGVGFEQFGTNPGFAEGCIPMSFLPNSFYNVKVITTPLKVTMTIQGSGVDEETELEFAGEYLSNDTIMGVAGDRKSATFGLFNLYQTIN